MVKQVTENWTSSLREMKVGDIIELPVKSITSVTSTIIPRLRLEMCVEDANWKRLGAPDREKGTFKVVRVS